MPEQLINPSELLCVLANKTLISAFDLNAFCMQSALGAW